MNNHMSATVTSPQEMKEAASRIVSTLVPKEDEATVIALSGDLGAGKTTFSQGVAEFFGVTGTVHSPTFVIMKRYEIDSSKSAFKNIIHIDAYRIEKMDEFLVLGWEKIIADPYNLVLVEWPENIIDILPQHCMMIALKHIQETERGIEVFQK
jgi:tRNA threonylcarbamoyladenosine biosynthesis protein TsaE